MSGHNKWSKVKHKKAAEDSKKSKIFSALSQNLTLESRACAGDRNSPTLRAVIDKAKAANMPSANIDRAIAKGVGGGGGDFEEVLYETYGPGGAALLIEGTTDNKNRTSSEVKHTLSKNGFSLSQPGSALWAFEKKDSSWEAKSLSPISESEREVLIRLVKEIESLDDIKKVYTNANIT